MPRLPHIGFPFRSMRNLDSSWAPTVRAVCSLSMGTKSQQYDRAVKVVSALLYSFDPEGIGSTVSSPTDEYDDASRVLVAQSTESSDLEELVDHHWPAGTAQLRSALIATLRLYRDESVGLPIQSTTPDSTNSDSGRSSADIRERTRSRLNAMLRRPGMYGLDVDLIIGSSIADMGFATRREVDLKEEGERLVARGGWSSRGVTGAFTAIDGELIKERVCSTYAEICNRLGWLDHDATTSEDSYIQAHNLGPDNVRAGHIRLEKELVDSFGKPSIRIGGNQGHVAGYVPASPTAPIVWFDVSDGCVIACRIETEALPKDLTVGPAVAAPSDFASISARRRAPLPFWARI